MGKQTPGCGEPFLQPHPRQAGWQIFLGIAQQRYCNSRMPTLTDASWCTMAAMSSAVKSRELPLVTTPMQGQGQGRR